MPTSPVSALTDLALAAFQVRVAPPRHDMRTGVTGDPVLDSSEVTAQLSQLFGSEVMQRAEQSLMDDPALAGLGLDDEGDTLGVLVEDETGASRIQRGLLSHGLLMPAMRLMYFRDATPTEGGLASLVIENYEELKRAVRGESVRTHMIYGLTGVTIPQDVRILTPWGIIKSAPVPAPESLATSVTAHTAQTTAVLIRQRLTKFKLARGEGSTGPPAGLEVYFAEERRIHELLPLAFALATADITRCAPQTTFRTDIAPFSSGWGSGSSWRPPRAHTIQLSADQVSSVEEWARRVDSQHSEGLQVAAKRTVSAIAERTDKADALIDAVTVWESLVGTRSETVFRVTAALTRLLEPNSDAREAFRKRLGSMYDMRSRVVHGEVVDSESLASAADGAIDIALAATRALYERGGDWLTMKSTSRADRLILGG